MKKQDPLAKSWETNPQWVMNRRLDLRTEETGAFLWNRFSASL
jgi:hypothetical protein